MHAVSVCSSGCNRKLVPLSTERGDLTTVGPLHYPREMNRAVLLNHSKVVPSVNAGPVEK